MRCLFTAPFSFLGQVRGDYEKLMPTFFQEVWERQDLPKDQGWTAWVLNPGQHFVVDEKVLTGYPSLSLLITPSTGINHIDEVACGARKLRVLSLLDNREGLNAIWASSEFTFLLLLVCLRHLGEAVEEARAGRWRRHEDKLRGQELHGKQVGIVGLGRIGSRLAQYAKAFGAKVAYHDPFVKSEEYPAWNLPELFEKSDAVLLCCSLTPQTTGMIHRELLSGMKQGACLVNTSRGEVLVEEDLVSVLQNRPDLRVGLDVLAGETTHRHLASRLLESFERSGQVVVTPHVAGLTVESQTQAARVALGLLRRHCNPAPPDISGSGVRFLKTEKILMTPERFGEGGAG